ncbi:uncharacterized protein LOC144424281 [Styela clava]
MDVRYLLERTETTAATPTTTVKITTQAATKSSIKTTTANELVSIPQQIPQSSPIERTHSQHYTWNPARNCVGCSIGCHHKVSEHRAQTPCKPGLSERNSNLRNSRSKWRTKSVRLCQ